MYLKNIRKTAVGVLIVFFIGCTGAQTRDQDDRHFAGKTVGRDKSSISRTNKRSSKSYGSSAPDDVMADISNSLSSSENPDENLMSDIYSLIEKYPEVPDTWFYAGMASYKNADTTDAVQYLNRAIQLEPLHETALLLLGDIASGKGDLTEADSMYVRAHRITKSPQSANRLALLRISGGYLESATEILQETISIYPDSAMTRNNLAVTLDHMGNTSAALNLLENVGDNERALLHTRALLELKKGHTKEAARDLETGYTDEVNLKSVLLGGILELQKGNLEAAERRFRKAIEHFPSKMDGYLNLGQTLRRQGRFSDSEEIYLKGIDATDSNDLHLNLGILYELYRNQPAKALDHYRKYVDLEGANTPRVKGWIDYLSGVVQRQDGN